MTTTLIIFLSGALGAIAGYALGRHKSANSAEINNKQNTLLYIFIKDE